MSTTTTTTTETKLKTTTVVQTLPATASIDEITAAMALAGGVIIKNAVSTDILDTIE